MSDKGHKIKIYVYKTKKYKHKKIPGYNIYLGARSIRFLATARGTLFKRTHMLR